MGTVVSCAVSYALASDDDIVDEVITAVLCEWHDMSVGCRFAIRRNVRLFVESHAAQVDSPRVAPWVRLDLRLQAWADSAPQDMPVDLLAD